MLRKILLYLGIISPALYIMIMVPYFQALMAVLTMPLWVPIFTALQTVAVAGILILVSMHCFEVLTRD